MDGRFGKKHHGISPKLASYQRCEHTSEERVVEQLRVPGASSSDERHQACFTHCTRKPRMQERGLVYQAKKILDMYPSTVGAWNVLVQNRAPLGLVVVVNDWSGWGRCGTGKEGI